DDVDEDVNLAAVIDVVEIQAPVPLHEVESFVRLIAERWKQRLHCLAVLLSDRIVKVAVLPFQWRLARARRAEMDSRPAQELRLHARGFGGDRAAASLGYRVFERRGLRAPGGVGQSALGQGAASTSMTIVLRSVICSSAKRPPTRPIPLRLPARPPKGRWASQELDDSLMFTQ